MRRRDFLGTSIAAGSAGVMGVFGVPRLGSAEARAQGAITPVDLRCEYLRTPLGILSLIHISEPTRPY